MNEIVGHCPVCNAPIYGPHSNAGGGYGNSPTVFGCDCRSYLVTKIAAETNLLNAQAERTRGPAEAGKAP